MNPDHESLLASFTHYLTQIGYGKGTVHTLPACVKDFLAFLNDIEIASITAGDIEAFYEHLHTRPHRRTAGALSEMYTYHHMYALKVFFNWLQVSGQLETNPISGMVFKKPQANARQPLSIEEIKQLFLAAGTHKERAMLHLFYSCGLRRSEAVALNRGDIDFSGRFLYVRQGKGGSRRAVPMTEKVATELHFHYLHQLAHNKADNEAFITGRSGKRMRGALLNEALKRMLQRAGLPAHISLHHLRHSIATHLLEGGMSLEYVSEFLGHKSLESTQIYTKVYASQLKKL